MGMLLRGIMITNGSHTGGSQTECRLGILSGAKSARRLADFTFKRGGTSRHQTLVTGGSPPASHGQALAGSFGMQVRYSQMMIVVYCGNTFVFRVIVHVSG